MDKEKRKLIVTEIEQWRRSKLLPEHYCDFLINLYLDDPGERPKKTWFGVSASSIQNSSLRFWLLLFGGIGLISYFVLHFNSFPLPMQIAISSLFILTCYMLAGVQRNKQPIVSYLCCGIASLSILTIGLVLLRAHDAGEGAVVGYVGLCSIVWMVSGISMRLPIFHFCGWIVLCLLYGWFLNQNISSFDWMALQMSWVPVSVVLAWLGWLIQYRSKASGTVLLAVGFLLWFVPEGFGLGLTELSRDMLQLSMFGKLMIAGAVLFASRKKWTEWVA
ncbi:hypothetical protein [Paenibacillus sp. MBLB4367]|uniref:hypothetical protein n=1 Tax=Paenibacillus sp. MBLB4367 TaxID=3384767 RepID=UPI0039083935